MPVASSVEPETIGSMTCVDGDELEPPWSRYPWIPMGSIGWRMGIGEGYQMRWGNHVEGTIPDLAAALAYLRRHPRAPRSWIGWIANWLAELAGEPEADNDDDAPNPWHARVDDDQLVGDDVAYPVWVRNCMRDGGMTAPWARPRGSSVDPQTAMRYGTRELGWWGRWLVTECADREAWLDEQPEAPEAWANVATVIRTGVAPPLWNTLDAGSEAFACVFAATGTLPPPWSNGHPPKPEIEWDEEDADDRDRWAWWTSDTFEDRTSWERYIAPWPPPEEWARVIADDYYLPIR